MGSNRQVNLGEIDHCQNGISQKTEEEDCTTTTRATAKRTKSRQVTDHHFSKGEANATKKLRKNKEIKKAEREVANAVRTSNIPKELHRSLIPSDSRTPQLYCLPKIHKPNVPLRPIVSAAESATHALAPYVAREIKDLVGKTEHRIRNTEDFIEKIKTIQLQPNDILVSFDVTSLFTKVPVEEALDELHRRLTSANRDTNLAELA